MNEPDRVFRVLRFARAAALLTLLLVAVAGAPETVVADGCYDWVFRCENDVDDCVAEEGSCWQPGECEGAKYCRPQFLYSECFGYEYIVMCEEEIET